MDLINRKIKTLVATALIFGLVGCVPQQQETESEQEQDQQKGSGTLTLHIYEDTSKDFLLAAKPATTENSVITFRKASEESCESANNTCIELPLNAQSKVSAALEAGHWHLNITNNAGFNDWDGTTCSIEIKEDMATEKSIVLKQGSGTTTYCYLLNQGVVVDLRGKDGEAIPNFTRGLVNLHKTSDSICNGETGTCIIANVKGVSRVAFNDIEATNWYIWAGGVPGYKAYNGYPCRFDVPQNGITYQTVRFTEGRGTASCSTN